MLKLEKIYRSEYAEDFVKNVLSGNYEVYLFGSYDALETICKLVHITGFVNTYLQENTFMGKPVLHSFEDVPCNALVISCVWMGRNTESLLSKYSFKHLDFWSFLRYSRLPLQKNAFFFCGAAEDIKTNFSRYETVYNRLADDISKNTFYNLVNFKYSGDMRYMRGFDFAIDKQYFEQFVITSLMRRGGVFVDAGGFDGGSTKQYIEFFPDYKEILLFEPAAENIEIAKSNLSGYKNIQYITKGLSDKAQTLCFNFLGSQSSVDANGTQEIQVCALDDFALERCDFIKMDIEGSEKEAIIGAMETINKCHPVLAICVYHKIDDFYSIPAQILQLHSDYKIYMRHYSQGACETVMYFVP